MNYKLFKELVEEVCAAHNLCASRTDVMLERNYQTGETSRIVVTANLGNPGRVVTIDINGEDKNV